MKIFEKKYGDWFNYWGEEEVDVDVWTTVKDAVKILLMVPVVLLCMIGLIALKLLSFIVPITLGAAVAYFTWTALSDRTETEEPVAKTQVVQQEKTP